MTRSRSGTPCASPAPSPRCPSISTACVKGAGSQPIEAVIYDDDGPNGAPGTLLATSEIVVIPNRAPFQWFDFPLPSPVTLAPGQLLPGVLDGRQSRHGSRHARRVPLRARRLRPAWECGCRTRTVRPRSSGEQLRPATAHPSMRPTRPQRRCAPRVEGRSESFVEPSLLHRRRREPRLPHRFTHVVEPRRRLARRPAGRVRLHGVPEESRELATQLRPVVGVGSDPRHGSRRASSPDEVSYRSPQPFARTGPGDALDGKPKFDLTQLNDEYFDRLRQRVRRSPGCRHLRQHHALRGIRGRQGCPSVRLRIAPVRRGEQRQRHRRRRRRRRPPSRGLPTTRRGWRGGRQRRAEGIRPGGHRRRQRTSTTSCSRLPTRRPTRQRIGSTT